MVFDADGEVTFVVFDDGGEVTFMVFDADGEVTFVVFDTDEVSEVWQLVPVYPTSHNVHVHAPDVPPIVPPLMQ